MQITAYNGVALNGATDYLVRFGYGQHAPYTAETQLRARVDQTPVLDSLSYGAREQPFSVYRNPRLPRSQAALMAFDRDVRRIFAVGGLRTLTARRDPADAATEMTVDAAVVSFGRVEDNLWQGTLSIPDPYWRYSAAQSASTSPATNSGQLETLPTITLSGTPNGTRNRVTVTDRTGHGLAAYPVRIDYGSGYDPANLLVYAGGRSIPFWYDTTSGALWVRIDVPPGGNTLIDVYRSATGIANTVTAQAMELGGLDPALSTNDVPVWNELQSVAYNPSAAALAWQPVALPNFLKGTSAGYGLLEPTHTFFPGDTLNGDSVTETFTSKQAGTYWNINVAGDNDATHLVLTSPVPAASGNALSGLRVTWAGGAWFLFYAGIWYRRRDELRWNAVYRYMNDFPSVAKVSQDPGALNVAGALQIALGFELLGRLTENRSEYQGAATFELIGSGGTASLALDSAQTPSVTVSADIDAVCGDAALTNDTTGDAITIRALAMDDTALTLDPNANSIAVATGPWYVSDILFTNAARWFRLTPGANAWTVSGLDAGLSWHEREAL